LPKRKLLTSFKQTDITEYVVSDAHPLVKELRDVAVKWKDLHAQLDEERAKCKPPSAQYDLSAHFVAANEFYFLLRISNSQEVLDYVHYWLKGPAYQDLIHSTSYYAIVDGGVVSLVDSNSSYGILRTPMHVERDVYERFRVTRKPMASWILSSVLPTISSGVDYSEDLE